MQVSAVRLNGCFADLVKMHCILFKPIVRRQVHAPAKPSHWGLPLRLGHNHSHIHVNRGYVGVARVKHQRQAHGLKRGARQFGAMLGG